jgi:hypothetical protein
MKLILSGNFPREAVSRVLADLREILPILDVETSIQRSSDQRFGLQVIGDVSEWTSPLATAASSFLTERHRRGPGKGVPPPGSTPILSPDVANSPLRLVARSLLDLFRTASSHEIRMRLGIPLPDHRFGTTLVIREGDEESVALSIAGFVSMLTDIEDFIRNELSGAKRSTGPVDVTPLPDGTMVVRWLDADTMNYHETTLRKQKGG